MLKKLFYASASILMLALAYHLGASTATAQSPGNSVVCALSAWSSYSHIVATANGDVYAAFEPAGPWVHLSNIFSGPAPAATQSWGSLKAKYR